MTNYREWLDDKSAAAIAVYGGEHYTTLAIRDANGGSVQFVISDPDEAVDLIAKFGRVMVAIRQSAAAIPTENENEDAPPEPPPKPDRQRETA